MQNIFLNISTFGKCNIVKKKSTKAQVKLLDGSFAGSTVWVIIESLHEK